MGYKEVKQELKDLEDDYQKQCKELFDCKYKVDWDSVSDCKDLKDEQKVTKMRTIGQIFYKSLLDNGYGLPRLKQNEEMWEAFEKRCKKIVSKYDNNSKRTYVCWDGDDLHVMWGTTNHTQYYNLFYIIKESLTVLLRMAKFEEDVVPDARADIEKSFGPGKSPKFTFDWGSFDKVEDESRKEHALNRMVESGGYYTLRRVVSACNHIAYYQEDEMCDVIAEHFKSIKFELKPGNETKEKEAVVKEGKLILKVVAEPSSVEGFFSRDELASLIMSCALKGKPKFRIFLLQSEAQSYRLRCWGNTEDLQATLKMDVFPQMKEKEEAAGKARGGSHFIKTWSGIKKSLSGPDYKGPTAKREIYLGTDYLATCQLSGESFKEKNFTPHEYGDIIAIDVCRVPSKVPGTTPLQLVIWTRKDWSEKKNWWRSMKAPKMSVPGVSMPSVPLPSVSMPSVSLPSVSLPSVSMPSVSMPSISMPSISLPSIFKREKKEPEKRSHPRTTNSDGKPYWHLVLQPAAGMEPGATKKANALVEEMAWAIYAAQVANTRSTKLEPFYLDAFEVFNYDTEIIDKRPKLEDYVDE